MPDSLLVLHTTEGSSFSGAKNWMAQQNTSSHVLYDPATDEYEQLIGWNVNARSLRNLSGGVETNNRGRVYQMEIVGRAADVPGYSDVWFQRLAGKVRDVAAATDTPLKFPWKFIPYSTVRPSSYGANNGVRMSNAEWLEASGVCGHMHVPENTHGDPGDMSRLVAILNGPGPEPAPPALGPAAMWQTYLNLHGHGLKVDDDFGLKTYAASVDHDAARIARIDELDRDLWKPDANEEALAALRAFKQALQDID